MSCYRSLPIDGAIFPINCITCNTAFTLSDLNSVFEPAQVGQIKSLAQGHFKMGRGSHEVDFCDTKGCNMLVKLPPAELTEEQQKAAGGYICHCDECRLDYCKLCTQKAEKISPPHKGVTCEQAQASGSPDVVFHRQKVEVLLCIGCPRCKKVKFDFSGCASLYCECACSFCAICFNDCGTDAHACAASCLAREGIGHGKYFIREDAWHAFLLTKRANEVTAYLRSIADRSLREQVFLAIQPLLKGFSGGDVNIAACP
jgi:hypothetical protein